MADFYKVKVLAQKVFHDGTNMVVLKPKGDNPEVAEQFIAGLVDEGFIEAPAGWEAPEVVDDGGVPVASADGGLTVNLPATEEDDVDAEDEPAVEGDTKADAKAKSDAKADKAP